MLEIVEIIGVSDFGSFCLIAKAERSRSKSPLDGAAAGTFI
jgi:hypothetical protein